MSIRDSSVSNSNSQDAEREARPTRRRGTELEGALLDAAWEELVTAGYGNFTIEAVASRAETSRAVVYRRWPGKSDLAVAAIRNRMSRRTPVIPDTGDLRNDLVGYLLEIAANRIEMMVLFSVDMAEFFSEIKLPLGELREKLLEGRPSGIHTILERAILREEIPRKEYSPRLLQLPFSLLAAELILSGKTITEAIASEIIDSIFLPLVLLPR